ncbi:MAG: hypothetical protein HKL81_05005 [Acidimicrobiaceae bacterium]|nr:hypothetical protein [Acidimicrobiaceae bacterium]
MTEAESANSAESNEAKNKILDRGLPVRRYLVIALAIIFVAAMWISNDHGMWIMTSVLGGIWGVVFKSKKSYLGATLLGGLAWLLPLLWDMLLGLDIPKAGTVVAELAGLGGSFLIPLLITILTGGLLAFAGAFLARSVYLLAKFRLTDLAQANKARGW